MGAHTERGNEMNELVKMVQTASKAKAPIVAISTPGRAPICVRAKLLKGALKGVTITSVEVVTLPDVETFKRPEREYVWRDDFRGYVDREGPANRIVTPGERRLKILGNAGVRYIRTSCSITPVPRHEALKELSKWSEREREKRNRRILMGDTVKSLPKRAKSYEYALDGDKAVTVTLRKLDKSTFKSKGVVIQLDAMPGYEFVLHAAGEPGEHYQWRVSERSSGICAGKGDTAAKAVESAESNWRKCDAAAMERAKQMIADNQLPAVVEVAA
jgi:hypothetical protein